MAFLHKNGIIHRDIKPNNVIINFNNSESFTVKLIDFGLSEMIFSKQTLNRLFGTIPFTAPEIIQMQKYTFTVDIWSFGVLAYNIQYDFLPFQIIESQGNAEMMRSICENELICPEKDFLRLCSIKEQNTYLQIEHIIEKTLDKDQSKRLSIHHMIKLLSTDETINQVINL